MISEKINHEYTDEIICPHCGYEHHDSWEYGRNMEEDIGEEECDQCSLNFNATRNISISYSTHKINCEAINLKHEYNHIEYFDHSNGSKYKIEKCEKCDYKTYIKQLNDGEK